MSYYSYIAYPIIALFLVIVITCITVIIVQRHNRLRLERVIQANPEAVNLNVIRTNIQSHENIPICHSDKCVYNDNNPPFWKLNCGGLVCNQCITSFSNALMSSESIFCPICREPTYVFTFFNSEGTQQPPTEFQNVSMSELCNICFERPPERNLECQSACNHMLCSFCYFRLLNVQKIKLCPFCRTPIRVTEQRVV